MRFWSSEIVETIRALMHDEQATAWQNPDLQSLAQTHEALLISSVMCHYLVKPNGEVILIEEDEKTISKDDRSQLQALAYAAKRYPELAGYIPDPPADSEPCTMCMGKGVRQDSPQHTCPACAGLGWVLV